MLATSLSLACVPFGAASARVAEPSVQGVARSDWTVFRLLAPPAYGSRELDGFRLPVGAQLSLQVEVERADGQPASNRVITVRWQPASLAKLPATVSTDADGRAALVVEALRPGPGRLILEHEGSRRRISALFEPRPPAGAAVPTLRPALESTDPGVVSWLTLSEARPGRDGVPNAFGARPRALAGTVVRVRGYPIAPLPGRWSRYFLLAESGGDCYKCMRREPDSYVQVFASEGIPISSDPVVLRGTLRLVRGGDGKLLYRLTEAVLDAP